MASRMEKYYKTDNVQRKRSQKNQELYRRIYDQGEYSNIGGIATIDKNNEIDITKVKRMLKNREDYKKQREYRSVLPTKSEVQRREDKVEKNEEFLLEDDNRNYDIRDVLNKVKEEQPEKDNRYLRLDSTNYDLLKELKEKKQSREQSDTELKEMIDTITNTSFLNKLGDEELSLQLLGDFEDHGTRVIDDDLDDDEPIQNETMDQSFFTSSMKFKKEDFADEYEQIQKKNRKIRRVIIIIFLLILIIIVIFFLIKLLK